MHMFILPEGRNVRGGGNNFKLNKPFCKML